MGVQEFDTSKNFIFESKFKMRRVLEVPAVVLIVPAKDVKESFWVNSEFRIWVKLYW